MSRPLAVDVLIRRKLDFDANPTILPNATLSSIQRIVGALLFPSISIEWHAKMSLQPFGLRTIQTPQFEAQAIPIAQKRCKNF